MRTVTYDYAVIGAGIVGAGLAAQIAQRRPAARILVVEKEPHAAFHQTGRNSGVVHSGVYYTPGSLKARFCREGLERLRGFCLDRGIRYEPRGKLLVATNAQEIARLSMLQERAKANDVQAEHIDGAALKTLEPAINGCAALRIPSTAIIDYTAVTHALLADVENAGGVVRMGAPVTAITRRGSAYRLHIGKDDSVEAGRVIACAGLASDRMARLMGIAPEIRIIPFRGEYFVLPAGMSKLVHHLIYPVPDPSLPFLGIHLTPMIDGTITVGPNAVLALAREKYSRFSVSPQDALSSLGYPGLWKMLARHPRATWQELKGSLFKRTYLQSVRKYCPSVTLADLRVYRSANRAQAVTSAGKLVDDFLIKTVDGATAVLNAPSPAATCVFPISDSIADTIL